MDLKKVIFLGSKPIGYNCLLYILDNRQQLGIDLIGVMTSERKEFGGDHDLANLADSQNIPVYNRLGDLPDCDIIYSVQYHEILKQEHINKAKQIAVNLHMAPLPEYRGSNQFSFAIIDGKTEFGTTIHKMSAGIDSGDIIFQKRFPIPENCWVDELYDLTYKASLNLFRQTLGHIVTGTFQTVPQELLESKYGTSLHYKGEIKKLKEIDLNWDAEKLSRHIRATYMPGFEPPYCLVNGEKVHFRRDRSPD